MIKTVDKNEFIKALSGSIQTLPTKDPDDLGENPFVIHKFKDCCIFDCPINRTLKSPSPKSFNAYDELAFTNLKEKSDISLKLPEAIGLKLNNISRSSFTDSNKSSPSSSQSKNSSYRSLNLSSPPALEGFGFLSDSNFLATIIAEGNKTET